MYFRSSNVQGFVHFQGDVVSNVESSHGVHLTGGSTGAIVQPASDDASAAMSIRAKGPSGILTLGTSTGGGIAFASGSSVSVASSKVDLVSSAVTFGSNPSSAGAVRLGYDAPIHGRTSTNGNTIQLLKTSTGDLVVLGDAAYGALIRGSSIGLDSTHVALNSSKVSFGTNPSSLGAVRLPYDAAIHGRTSTDGNSIQMLKTSTGDLVVVGDAAYGALVRGSSVGIESTHINLNSTRVVVGPSTTPISLIQRSLIQFTIPAMSSLSADESVEVAVTGLTTNALVFIQQRVPYNSTVVAGIEVDGYCSTAGALRLKIVNHTASTISGSTASAYLWRIECPVAV